MRRFYITKYKLYRESIASNFRICIMSDLHFSKNVSNEKLDLIYQKVIELKPDYILFPGDLIDSIQWICNYQERNRLISWLKKLCKQIVVIIVLGNHDIVNIQNIEDYAVMRKFHKDLNSIFNIHLLDNNSFEDENIFVTGYTQSLSYYRENYESKFFKKALDEDKEQLKKELKWLVEITKFPNKDKIKILLAHSPIFMRDEDVLQECKNYNYILSGHMHYGCVPPILNELWNSDRGIIAPDMTFFSRNERNTLRNKSDKLLVNGPLTTFHNRSGFFQKLNFLFPIYLSVMEFTTDKNYDREKLYIEKGYYK